MNNENISEELISQIKNATKADSKLVEETKNIMKLQMKKEIPQRRTFMKKAGISITSVACIVILCICVGKFLRNNNISSVNKESGKIVNENAKVNDINVAGKSGKDLLNMVQIEDAKDIAKIVICQNELVDISWVEPIADIEIIEEDDISYFYSQFSKLSIAKENSEIIAEREIDAPKEREILLYLQDGIYEKIHYYPMSNSLMECFEINGEAIERRVFEQIPEEFATWLIHRCNIEITKDYTKEYEHYQKIQTYSAMLQQFEEESWYGGFDEVFDNGILTLKVLLCDNSKNNQNTVLAAIGATSDVIFETSKVNYRYLKNIKEKISASIMENHDKYYYVVGCALTSKDVSIDMFEDVTKEQRNEFLKDFSEYCEFISIQ